MKRIICTLLVLSMLLSAMPAFAKDYLETYKYMDQIFRFDVGEFVTSSGDNAASGGVDTDQELINFLDFVGVWDNVSAKKNAHLTQTEFSIIMSKLKLGSKNALIDVYLENPDDSKVTYLEAYKQTITALGYYYMCETYDNPEDWILFVADEIDLLVSIPNNMNEYITRAELAKIITKALNIDLSVIEYTADGYRYEVAEGKNLLNSVHNLHDISGFVNAIYGLSVYSGNDCREGYIQINRRNIKTSGLELDHYLGRMVRAYASYDEVRDEYSVVYIDYDQDAKYSEIDFADIADISNDKIYYYGENGEEKELNISNIKNVTENGKMLNSISEMSDFANNEGKIILTSSEKYGDIDTAVIYKYTYAMLEYNDTLINQIGFKNYQKYNDTADTFVTVNDRAVKKVTLNGEKVELSALPAGVTVRLFKNEQTGYMEIIATNEKVVGQITSIDGDYYAIDDNWYRISKDFKKVLADDTIPANKQLKPLELGLSTTFFVLDGVIVSYAKASEYKYGYLKAVSQARSGIDPDLTLRIFTQDGEWIDLKVTKPVEFEGEKNVEKADLYEAIASEAGAEVRTVETKIIGNIIRYKSSGDILTALDSVNKSRFETNSTEALSYDRFNTEDGNWTNDWLAMSYPYMITENTILFAIPKEADNEDLYSMTNNTAISGIAGDQGTMPSHFFNTNELCEVGVVLIEGTINDIKGNQSSGGANYYVTKVMNAVIDADNQEFGYKIVGEKLTTGVALGVAYATAPGSFYVTKEMFDKNPIGVGDFISASVSGGKASSWSVILAGGRVPEEVSYKTTSTTGFRATGYLAAFDAATDRAVIEIRDEEGNALVNDSGNSIEIRHPIVCRAKIIINPDKNELTSTTLSGFHVGDKVYTSVGYGRASYIIKNVFGN